MNKRRRIVAALAAAGLVVLSLETTGHTSVPTAQTVDGSHSVSWLFAPAGGPSAAADSHDLTVKLPDAPDKYYAPDVAHGTKHAAALSVIITYAPPSSLDALSLS